jgi:hypothetical protein
LKPQQVGSVEPIPFPYPQFACNQRSERGDGQDHIVQGDRHGIRGLERDVPGLGEKINGDFIYHVDYRVIDKIGGGKVFRCLVREDAEGLADLLDVFWGGINQEVYVLGGFGESIVVNLNPASS